MGAYYSAKAWWAHPHPHPPTSEAGLEEGGEVAALLPVGGKEVEGEAGGWGYFVQGAYQVLPPLDPLVYLLFLFVWVCGPPWYLTPLL